MGRAAKRKANREKFQRNKEDALHIYDAVIIARSCYRMTGRGFLFIDASLGFSGESGEPQSNVNWVRKDEIDLTTETSDIDRLVWGFSSVYNPENQAVVYTADPRNGETCLSLIENSMEFIALSILDVPTITQMLCFSIYPSMDIKPFINVGISPVLDIDVFSVITSRTEAMITKAEDAIIQMNII